MKNTTPLVAEVVPKAEEVTMVAVVEDTKQQGVEEVAREIVEKIRQRVLLLLLQNPVLHQNTVTRLVRTSLLVQL